MRLGVLDVGSNTVHLQVVDAHPGARPSPATNQKVELRLHEYLNISGEITPEGVELLETAIADAISHAKEFKTEEILAFATSAIRDAKNGKEILLQINKKFDIDLQVLSGDDEARMTFLAVRRWLGWSSGRLLVLDIGGGSLEIALGDDESAEATVSLPLGASRLTRAPCRPTQRFPALQAAGCLGAGWGSGPGRWSASSSRQVVAATGRPCSR